MVMQNKSNGHVEHSIWRVESHTAWGLTKLTTRQTWQYSHHPIALQPHLVASHQSLWFFFLQKEVHLKHRFNGNMTREDMSSTQTELILWLFNMRQGRYKPTSSTSVESIWKLRGDSHVACILKTFFFFFALTCDGTTAVSSSLKVGSVTVWQMAALCAVSSHQQLCHFYL